jgi:hypothetical protein
MAKGDTTKLVVVNAFDDYRRGDEITDDAVIKTIIGTEVEANVRKVVYTPASAVKEG